MWPLSDKRVLNVVVQRQFKEKSMIGMQFTGLKYLKLFPVSEDDFEDYEGTLICAEGMRWRNIENKMGAEEFYLSPV